MPLVITTPHNQAQPLPDRLTTLVVNNLWRRYIADALTQYFERAIGSDTTIPGVPETLNNFHNLLLDLYDAIYEIKFMRIATVHLDPTVVYNASQNSRVEFDNTLGPFNYDPDGMFIPASNTFQAIETGIYALVCYVAEVTDSRDFMLFVQKVGAADEYAGIAIDQNSGLLSVGTVFGLFRADFGDEFEVRIAAAGLSVAPDYGYAAFVQLAQAN